jgi:hypothetical protein
MGILRLSPQKCSNITSVEALLRTRDSLTDEAESAASFTRHCSNRAAPFYRR